MKTIYLLLLILLCTVHFSLAQTHHKVLFLGNSYTQYNNMASITASIANSLGDTLTHDQSVPGGHTFEGHNSNATSLSKINANNWDYVVLQEQSQKPSFHPSQVAAETYPFADSLNRKIKANDSCTTVMFYMTWGRENGDASNCGGYPPLCTYEGMQQRLRESYLEMGQTHNAEVAPIGMVWKAIRDSFPTIDLYNADESHPSLTGSYLVACTFYASMYHKSCVGAYTPTGVSASTALSIQQTVDKIVFDSLGLWGIDTTTLSAAINVVSKDSTDVSFSTTASASSYEWSFGDGNTSSLPSPTHSYTTDSITTYQVRLTTTNACETASSTYSVTIDPSTTTSINNNDLIGATLYPIPTNNTLYLSGISNANGTVQIFNLNGKLLIEKPIELFIDVSYLDNGTYILAITQSNATQVSKFIVLK